MRDEHDVNNLQRDIWSICEWSKIWQMKLNLDKCKLIHFGKTNNREKYLMEDSLGKSSELSNSMAERYLDIMVSEDLKWKIQIDGEV